MRKVNLDKEWLEHQYSSLQRGAPEIARECECATKTVYNWLKRFHISTRSCSEAQRISQSNHVSLSSEVLEFLNGLLLGDGHLATYEWSAAYVHTSKYETFLEWLSGKLDCYGIQRSGRIKKYAGWRLFPDGKVHYAVFFHYISRYYTELKDLWSQWYIQNGVTKKGNPKFRKVVPPGLKLTPTSCLHWYIGDGCLCQRVNSITLNTQSFSDSDIQLLRISLEALGFSTSFHSNRTIYIKVGSVTDFLDFVGLCPKKLQGIYGYKWNTRRK